ncbi:MAG: response regulator transcription factor [Spirochaetales bacterium]|uniref:Response regulator transcription factor n=1 Tax=Candidatus Thalassospirochaeta sargassi TaxID=3119039 RepID=A0AAJ1MPW0_9SPIO|nr:response regulator transcription factor [Spirochaetales bacterium]
MKIYIVEDNENVREAAAGYLKLEGFEIEEFAALKPVRRTLLSGEELPDLIVLDVMLPDGDGFLFAKQLKEESMEIPSSSIPIIFLTARDQESDRITGLELGADDYIIKPFSTRELVLRVKAVLRRSSAVDNNATLDISYGIGANRLEISELNHQILYNGEALQLTAAEWSILLFLSAKSPQVFSRLQILENCLDSFAEGSERTVDTHIKNIRHKLLGADWIETVRGFGYRFNGQAI